ncbi:HtaA domain-containing protein [Chryseoglobus sp. 28M-23]|uniref:HtaA domain-containing protein n=1 Tax=Chryseoglobus sp. 28M-23 TaxID=2772253 RepID=UPI0017465DB6|nr:HtaA domain-containing protein [Chryseoglobus sp. 28M-23]QOD93974.1 HtaA domain-containing protein [Chryseoglobus sp. 28M-23]
MLRRFRRRLGTAGLALAVAAAVGLGLSVGAETERAAAASVDECAVQDARLEWGFKESFRAYVSGSIANGEWQAADGATYATPSFTFGEGSGAVASGSATAELFFAGSIRFTGHGDILDTTVSMPRVALADAASGLLVLDVVGTTQEGAEVAAQGVEFASLDLTAATRSVADGVLTVEGIAAALTEDGAAAFGTYPAGEPLDPITIVAPLDPACAAEVEADLVVSGGASWVAPALTGAGVVLALAVLTVGGITVVRRRRAP